MKGPSASGEQSAKDDKRKDCVNTSPVAIQDVVTENEIITSNYEISMQMREKTNGLVATPFHCLNYW